MWLRLSADNVDISVMPDPDANWTDTDGGLRRSEAEMTFYLQQGLRVGYRGFLDCAA